MNKVKIKHLILEFVKETLLFSSLQSKVFAFFALISLIVFYIKYRNIHVILTKFIAYFILIKHLECYVHGNCNFAAWVSILLPILLIIIYLLQGSKYFRKTEKKLIEIYKKLNVLDFIEKIELYNLVIALVLIILFVLIF